MKAREFTPCLCCGKGIAHNADLAFLRVRFDLMALNIGAIRRQHGLEMMMGNAAIAQALGTDEDMARQMTTGTGLICGSCMVAPWLDGTPFHILTEIENRKPENMQPEGIAG